MVGREGRPSGWRELGCISHWLDGRVDGGNVASRGGEGQVTTVVLVLRLGYVVGRRAMSRVGSRAEDRMGSRTTGKRQPT